MCQNCKDNEGDMYPDLGQGSMMEVKDIKTWMSADKDQGIRIAQTRHVTYMGPEGVQSREETQCVYIGWNDLEPDIALMLMLQTKTRNNNETPD